MLIKEAAFSDIMFCSAQRSTNDFKPVKASMATSPTSLDQIQMETRMLSEEHPDKTH